MQETLTGCASHLRLESVALPKHRPSAEGGSLVDSEHSLNNPWPNAKLCSHKYKPGMQCLSIKINTKNWADIPAAIYYWGDGVHRQKKSNNNAWWKGIESRVAIIYYLFNKTFQDTQRHKKVWLIFRKRGINSNWLWHPQILDLAGKTFKEAIIKSSKS